MEVENYSITYRRKVVHDLNKISAVYKKRILSVIQRKIMIDPVLFGESLRISLSGYRRMRVGKYRIIYFIYKKEKRVRILIIGHRKDIYEKAQQRI